MVLLDFVKIVFRIGAFYFSFLSRFSCLSVILYIKFMFLWAFFLFCCDINFSFSSLLVSFTRMEIVGEVQFGGTTELLRLECIGLFPLLVFFFFRFLVGAFL